MTRERLNLTFLGAGHFLDHFFMLIFATVAALRLAGEWGMSYAALIPYATPGFVAFGVGALPAGWIADRWSRKGMMTVFFIGIGLASVVTATATTPVGIGAGLLGVGVFASIYHPVGLAMVVHGRQRTGMPLAVNAVFGNLGVAAAALGTGFLIDAAGWRSAFALPGVVAVLIGIAFGFLFREEAADDRRTTARAASVDRRTFWRVAACVVLTTGIGGLVFQSATFALPRVLDERLAGLAESATAVGGYAFVVFVAGAIAQLIVGLLVDRHSLKAVFGWVAATQAVLFTLMVGLTGPLTVVVAAGFMFVVFGQVPINDVLVSRIASGAWRSRMYAVRYVVTFSVMATTLPVIAGIHASQGFDALFRVMAVAATAIFGVVLALPRRMGAPARQ